ncbi:hypothetical protein SLEP1_g5317 [Rubroshorea leprosula]|uniref:Uncharacterized protein n=1 Tax=Rubroshorea leprosula TaxID=152421 RepID=A0AAV5HRV1_9ROSI|nr:hypothetical protein SLEP1_g5317 [Rubroshorea leprosula]
MRAAGNAPVRSCYTENTHKTEAEWLKKGFQVPTSKITGWA